MSAPNSQPPRKKVVHQLDTPFSTVPWPSILIEDQDTILELLCDLLSPIGQYRQTQIKRSKGKRSSQKEKGAKKTAQASEQPPVPPMPEIEASIDVGLNSITRNLQLYLQQETESMEHEPYRQYSMVFVARGDQASTFNCHFPQMIGAASRKTSSERKTRLVGLSKPCSERLSSCLGVPRVSSVAIRMDAPGAGALQEFVMKKVEPIEASWLDVSSDVQYLAPKINAIETTVGPKRARVE
ncbi:rnase subunit pop3 [Fusarium pseudoanthophilum]|uniref:Rnase subunit pop3 n=1 Tax=Fusarium pseudoanthophilum TaxID=48495 RepID=A0A8H5Q7T4_9HYPO|nr:rnase subunit pop3 [Fusarium pseudoanthophilum]